MTDFAGCRESSGGVGRIVGVGVILLVAGVAQRAVQRIIVVDVAVSAHARGHRVRTGERESRGVVVERPIGPQHSVVTDFARGRDSGGNMIHRRGGIVIVRLVTRDAGGARKVVVVIDVAIGALPWRYGMATR